MQARIDSKQEVIVGVNKYQLDEQDPIDVLVLDNTATRAAQVAKINRVRAERDEDAACAALAALQACAEDSGSSDNLMKLAIDAARERCTVGENSDACENAWGRANITTQMVSGAYSQAYGADSEMDVVLAAVEKFEEDAGRRPRLMVAVARVMGVLAARRHSRDTFWWGAPRCNECCAHTIVHSAAQLAARSRRRCLHHQMA